MLAVEPAFELGAVDGDLDRVPLLVGNVDVLGSLLDEAALALVERPEHEIVLLAVESHGEVIPVRLQVEKDAGALIEAAAEDLETHRDLAVVEVVDVLSYGVREVSEGLDVVDELLVARAIDGAGFVRQAARRLAPLPLAAVHQ